MPARWLLGFVAALCILASGACGEADTRTTSPPASLEPTVELLISPQLNDSAFLGARTVLELADGSGFVAADAYVPRLVFFDFKGGITRSVGRAGDGPGEYERVSGLVRVDDGLVAWDFFKMRITVLTSAGAVMRTAPTPFIGASASPSSTRPESNSPC